MNNLIGGLFQTQELANQAYEALRQAGVHVADNLRGVVEATYVRGTLAFDRRHGPAASPSGRLLLPNAS